MPSRFDAAVVSRHCAELGHAYDEYKRTWVDVAKPFLAALRPKDLPGAVVYPFGGGDLVTAANGAAVRSGTQLRNVIGLSPIGADVRLTVDRRGSETTLTVRVEQATAANAKRLTR